MSVSLPPELIDSILSHLCGTPTIAECALVCHSWLPGARYHLLPHPKVLHLDQIQIAEYLRLIDSPGSTLSLVSFSTLHLAQNRVVIDWDNPIPPEGEVWRSHTGVRDLLVRNLPFPPITSLFLEWIDWRTLSQPALTSLHSSFKSVKELDLKWIAITLPELGSLIAALTALEKITVGAGVPFDSAPSTVDSVQITHSNLCKLAFTYPHPSWMIQFFSRAIQYFSRAIRYFSRAIRHTAGIVALSIDLPMQGKSQEFKACGELLEIAGTNLRAFKLRTSHYSIPLPGDDAGEVSMMGRKPMN
jgi:hypothetical protein